MDRMKQIISTIGRVAIDIAIQFAMQMTLNVSGLHAKIMMSSTIVMNVVRNGLRRRIDAASRCICKIKAGSGTMPMTMYRCTNGSKVKDEECLLTSHHIPPFRSVKKKITDPDTYQ